MSEARQPYTESRIQELRCRLRDPDEFMRPEWLGAVRPMRHSFARAFTRHAARHRWHLEKTKWELDEKGRGETIYTVRTHERPLHFVVFSDEIPDEKRTDRVVAEAWDVTAVLCEGDLDPNRLETMRREVPKQEGGRADPGSLAWTRGNRSSRFFDYVVERLAAGEQPEIEELGDAGYILRSTAFYANGKFGTTPFRALDSDHPVGRSYRAQMLAAWVFREFSYDLVEHCARVRNPEASRLEGGWRRYFGIGNATGLGMVPFFPNHPAILDSWCTVRELALANATDAAPEPGGPDVTRMLELIDRGICFYEERTGMDTEPFVSCEDLAAQLASARELVAELVEKGTMLGQRPELPWKELRRWAERELDFEGQELIHGLLIELYNDLDEALEELLEVDETTDAVPHMRVGQLREIVDEDYVWAFQFDFDDPDATHYFWYVSSNNEEPRRGLREKIPGEEHEQPYDIARQVQRLCEDLEEMPGETLVAEFLLTRPEHRGIVERIQSFHNLPYAEVRTNLLAADFLPLHLQRFKLAMYGMENYDPKSTDWVRVTLFQGAPRADDVAAGEEGDWVFPLKPRNGGEAC